MPNIKFNVNSDNEVVKEEKAPKAQKKVPAWIFMAGGAFLLTLVLIIGGTIFLNQYQEKKAKEESLQTLKESLNVVFTADKDLLIVEAAPALTYSTTKYEALKNVPDQLRNLFISYTGDSAISVSDFDISTVGEKPITVTITKSDRFGQTASKQERIIITVKDTVVPKIGLISSPVVAKSEQEVDDNVQWVVDDVFGTYHYESNIPNHSYMVDSSKIDFKTPGNYQAIIRINDSGNIIERYFNVHVPKLDANGNIAEDIIVEPTVIEDEDIIVENSVEETPTDVEVSADGEENNNAS